MVKQASIAFAVVMSVCAGWAQHQVPVVEGRVEAKAAMEGFTIELRTLGASTPQSRAEVERDGSFVMRNVEAGSYILALRTFDGDLMLQQGVTIASGQGPIALQLAGPAPNRAPANAAVSVGVLTHPPLKKALKAAEAAQRFSEAGEHAKAAAELEKAVTISPDFADARNNLGAQYLFLSRFQDAAEQLEASIKIGESSMAYCNLSLAYSMLGREIEAETAARRAVTLDSSNPRSHLRLGAILADRAATREEAIRELKIAAPHVRSAYALLAHIYLAGGQRAEAEEALRQAQAPLR